MNTLPIAGATAPTVFTFTNGKPHAVRIVYDTNGDPLFNVNDLCDLLEHSNPRQALIDNVEKDDVSKSYITDRLGRKQSANFVNESGMWSLLLGSHAPNAKKIKHWVTSEVLPTIRKTGAYIHAPAMRPSLTIAQQEQLSKEAYKLVGNWIFTPREDIRYVFNHLRVAFQVADWRNISEDQFEAALMLVKSKQESSAAFLDFITEAKKRFEQNVLAAGTPWTPSIKSKLTHQLKRQVILPPVVDWLALQQQATNPADNNPA